MNNTQPKLIKQYVPFSRDLIWNAVIVNGVKCPKNLCDGPGKKKTYHTIYQLNYHLSYHHKEECIEQRKQIVNALLLLVTKGVLQTERRI